MRDEDLLVRAQEHARALVERDPDLTSPASAKIRETLDSRYRERFRMYGVG